MTGDTARPFPFHLICVGTILPKRFPVEILTCNNLFNSCLPLSRSRCPGEEGRGHKLCLQTAVQSHRELRRVSLSVTTLPDLTCEETEAQGSQFSPQPFMQLWCHSKPESPASLFLTPSTFPIVCLTQHLLSVFLSTIYNMYSCV